jgi:hypothetical protein
MHSIVESEHEIDAVALEVCPVCSALNQPMGCLGTLVVIRCERCGWTWQEPVPEAL